MIQITAHIADFHTPCMGRITQSQPEMRIKYATRVVNFYILQLIVRTRGNYTTNKDRLLPLIHSVGILTYKRPGDYRQPFIDY